MKTYTIGFTQKSAEKFFGLLRENDVRRLLDVRLNNVSQLAGFAKKQDLAFFLKEICNIGYIHLSDAAPTKDILDAYKRKSMTWSEYEDRYLDLIVRRNVERTVDRSLIEHGCLLCSEHKPHCCHRRVLAEYLDHCWGSELEIIHLM